MQHLSFVFFITNTLAKDKHIEDTWRGYPNPTSERHLINQVEPAAIESLTDAVKKLSSFIPSLLSTESSIAKP